MSGFFIPRMDILPSAQRLVWPELRAAAALGREAAHSALFDQAVKRTVDRAAAGSFVAHGREQLLDRELLVRVRRQKRQQRTALLRVITVSHGFASKSGMNPEFKP